MGTVIPIGEARSRRATPAPPLSDGPIQQAVAGGTRLYTCDEVSRLLRRSARSIRRDVSEGCPRIPVGKNSYRFILDDVVAWHANRQEAAASTKDDAA